MRIAILVFITALFFSFGLRADETPFEDGHFEEFEEGRLWNDEDGFFPADRDACDESLSGANDDFYTDFRPDEIRDFLELTFDNVEISFIRNLEADANEYSVIDDDRILFPLLQASIEQGIVQFEKEIWSFSAKENPDDIDLFTYRIVHLSGLVSLVVAYKLGARHVVETFLAIEGSRSIRYTKVVGEDASEKVLPSIEIADERVSNLLGQLDQLGERTEDGSIRPRRLLSRDREISKHGEDARRMLSEANRLVSDMLAHGPDVVGAERELIRTDGYYEYTEGLSKTAAEQMSFALKGMSAFGTRTDLIEVHRSWEEMEQLISLLTAYDYVHGTSHVAQSVSSVFRVLDLLKKPQVSRDHPLELPLLTIFSRYLVGSVFAFQEGNPAPLRLILSAVLERGGESFLLEICKRAWPFIGPLAFISTPSIAQTYEDLESSEQEEYAATFDTAFFIKILFTTLQMKQVFNERVRDENDWKPEFDRLAKGGAAALEEYSQLRRDSENGILPDAKFARFEELFAQIHDPEVSVPSLLRGLLQEFGE